jgi:type VI secretion system secreted protein VgrG
MSEPTTLANVSIHVEGVNDPLSFNALSINQQLADVNDFSFNWRQEEGEGSLSVYVNFNRDHLAKEVTIDIDNHFTFKGIIYAIHCIEQDANGITYQINGKGLFVKLTEVAESNSFYQKDLRHIFNALNITQGTTLQLNPRYTSNLFYTVQYNQSAFDFYRMTAARYGEWLYYNGQELVLGPPSGAAVDISDLDIDNLTFRSRLDQSPMNAVGFDNFTGTVIRSTEQASQPGGTGFVAANMQAGISLLSPSSYAQYAFVGAPTEGLLAAQSLLHQQGRAASSAVVTGNTYNSNLRLGGKINITDNDGNSFGEYIITEMHHYSSGATNYQNYFSAIPSEVEAPPYTNPMLHTYCPAQMATVVHNEDEDGQDRVKVHFPWQASGENTPWLKVVVPHAGQGYGFRFLPEIDDTVYVDFLNNDPELPFVMGCVYADNRRSGTAHDGNHQKIIGTRSGRRLEINDDRGIVKLMDNTSGSYPYNVMALIRDDAGTTATLQSHESENNASLVHMHSENGAMLSVMKDGENILYIELNKQDNKITIHSKQNIDINADGNINLNAANININASQELKLDGTAKGIKLEGQKISQKATTNLEIEATANLKLTGLNTTLQGNVQAEVKGGAMAAVTAAIVKIN